MFYMSDEDRKACERQHQILLDAASESKRMGKGDLYIGVYWWPIIAFVVAGLCLIARYAGAR